MASDLAGLEPILARPLSPAGMLVRHLQSKAGQEERVQALADDLQKQTRYDLAPEDAFLLALARKNPSASRLLRVWQTTEELLKEQAEGLRMAVEERQRAVFTLESKGSKPPSGLYTADVPLLGRTDLFVRPDDGKGQTVVWLMEKQVERLRREVLGREVRLVARETGQAVGQSYTIAAVASEAYRPFQVITVGPNLLLAMLPANRAMEVAEGMQHAYTEELSKVQGRLPFHVGLVFMDAHYPMFAALDTARRLAETFDALDDEPLEATLEMAGETDDGYDLTMRSDRFGAWTWHVPAVRGDEAVDWYHPYFLVREGEGLEERGMSLIGPEGRWVHVSQLRPGDRVALWPNFFDFLFLDTVSRRFEAQAVPESNRRPHALLGRHHSSRPYLLDGVARLREVWEAIRAAPGMSETRLEGATSLLAQKWQAWQLANADSPERRADWESYRWLVKEVVARDFGGSATIEEAILDGAFFDTVELYRHILKEPIESRDCKTAGSSGQDQEVKK